MTLGWWLTQMVVGEWWHVALFFIGVMAYAVIGAAWEYRNERRKTEQ